jgi:hypothetical protein
MADGEPDEERISELASRPAGYDSEDPYGDVDLDELPRWWRETVEEFREYGLRPYRPPRFADGALKHEVVDDIERDLDVDVGFVKYSDSDDWTVLLDGAPVDEIGHHRATEGFSVFEMDGDSFTTFIEERVTGAGPNCPTDNG